MEGAPKKFNESLYRDEESGELRTEEEIRKGLKSRSRRNFLKAGVAAGIAAGLPSQLQEKERTEAPQEQETKDVAEAEGETEEKESDIERNPEGKNVFEQLEEFGEVVDMEAAVEAMYDERYKLLTETPDGRKRVADIVARFQCYDPEALAQPFRERGLAEWLAMGLPAHESDWLSQTSPSGAIGTHQLKPQTVKNLGYPESAALRPDSASEVSAEYLKQERDRFGDDIYMQLYAYVAGYKLNGFTESEPDRDKWTREHFYAFIQERLNETFQTLQNEGFIFDEKPVQITHTIQEGDTMWSISKEYGLSMDLICKENGIEDPDSIHAGDTLQIPYKSNLEKEMRTRNWSTFHMLEYAPHLIAMYDAAAKLGYVASRDETDEESPITLASSKE